jgi:GT2 family glycosyltransferase
VSSALPDVIVPIHDGADALARCLESLADTLAPAVRCELIDDASRDPRVSELIGNFIASAPCRVQRVRQDTNLGFVATVNGAFARTRSDVVLLNSDTVTTRGWLERLAACGASDERIATVTPFSNNAEICSFPALCVAAPMPVDPERIAQACRLSAPPRYPELPTAVGFCMWIARRALNRIGAFDAETFGRGYGEENDFCLRATGHGFRNVLCDDAYVAHQGGASFAPLGLAPGGANAARLSARYPGYNATVAAFIAADPLAARRAEIAAWLDAHP